MADREQMPRASYEPLPGEPDYEVDHGSRRDHDERARHCMSCAARTPQSRVDERKPRTGKRDEQDQDEAECGGRFRERRTG